MTTDETPVSQACFTCNTPLDLARMPRKGRWPSFVGADGGGIVVDGRTIVFAVEATRGAASRPAGVRRRLASLGARPHGDCNVPAGGDSGAAVSGVMGVGVLDDGRRLVTAEPPPGAVLMCAAEGGVGEGLVEAALEAIADEAILAVKDAGGGGLGRALAAMTVAGEVSMEVDLDRVPGYDVSRDAVENLIDGTCDRLLLAVVMGREDDVRERFARHGVACEIVGETGVGDALTIRVGGKTVAEVPIESLAPSNEGGSRSSSAGSAAGVCLQDRGEAAGRILAQLGSVEREWSTGGRGPVQFEPLPCSSTNGAARSLTTAFEALPLQGASDARDAARRAVAEAVVATVRCGGEPAALVYTLAIGAARGSDRGALLKGVADGLAEACTALEIPVVAGDLSLDEEGADATLCIGVAALSGEPPSGGARA